MNAMQLVQGVVELSEDGNTVTMVECTNAHLIGLLPPSSALFISEGQGPHPKLSPGVYLPPSSARLRTPARTQVTSPQATFGVAATSEGLNHPLRQSIKAASNSSLGSLVSRDIASRDDDRNNVEEPMDYFSTLHHSSGSGDFTPTANTVTHRSVSRVAPDSVEGSVFSGPVPMDGGDPTFVNFTAASPSTTLFDKRHVVAGNDAAADSLSTSVGSQHTDRRPPTLGSLPTPGQLPAGLHSSFLTYLHMLRSVQQPREESPLNAEAAIPGFPGTRTSVPESPMEGPRPSMYRKRANTLASSTTSSLESALRSWRFDYSPAMRDPGTPGSGSSRELESRSWSVACFPVPSVEDARDPALEGSSKVGLSSAGRSSSTFRLPSDRVRAGFVMYDVTSYRKEVHRVEERCKTRDRELKQRVDFLSQVSHEIRTPLHGLLGFTSLLDVSTGLTQDQRDLLKAIRDCSESLHSIVSEFLDWSKLESGKAELEINPFDLRETVASLGMIWKLQGSRKGLSRLGVEVEDTVPRIVYGDVERLKQVLNNMLSNATKFTPPGGTVDLKVSCSGVPISAMRAPSGPFAHASGTMSIGSGAGGTASRSGSIASASGPIVPGGAVYLVTFSVWDSGIGISPAGRAKLFQNYAQADSSISRRFGGTGLGLAISRGIVELMGGKMDVESSDEPGQSFSRFWIEIPLTVAPETLISPMPGPGLGTGFANETRRRSAWVTNYAVSEDAPVAEQAPLKLLVAEDNPLNQKLIQRLLGKLGYNELQIVGDGKECFEKVLEASKAKQPFDLVFMDVQMPVCDGLEATERIRASEELSQAGDQPFVVAMSAGVMPEDQDRCYEVGMDSFLAKPLNMSDLIATLKRFWNELVERRGSEGSESEEPADAGPGPL